MKKLKTNTGITLVALIITIIVLLILAVVSIRAITGGEGIFIKTENATQRYEEERLKEENTIKNYIGLIDPYLPSDTTRYYYCKDFEFEGTIAPAVISMEDKGENKKLLIFYAKNASGYKKESVELEFEKRTFSEDTTINGIPIESGSSILYNELVFIKENITYYIIEGNNDAFELTTLNENIQNVINQANN